MKKLFLCLCFIVFSSGISAFGANFYVDPNGNDSNPGSLSSPFATLQHAIGQAASPGMLFI